MEGANCFFDYSQQELDWLFSHPTMVNMIILVIKVTTENDMV